MKNVCFTEKSKLYLYTEDICYSQTKSYRSSSKASFSQDAVIEALRFKNKLMQGLEERSLTAQLQACGVSYNSIIGLEQLIFEDPKSIAMRRKLHVQAILAQQELQGGRDSKRIAKLSGMMNDFSSKQAQIRASRVAKSCENLLP